MKRYPIHSKGNDVFFEINLIGYKNVGESVVLTVKDELENILWCGIIDCYKYKKYNKTKMILDEYGYGNQTKKIDFLCISHPDYDHIMNLAEIIDNFTDDNTMFVMPNFLDSHIRQTREVVKIKEIIEKRFCNPKTRTSVSDNIFFNRNLSLGNLKWEFISGIKKYNMQIESLTPPDSVMLNSMAVNYQQFKNDFSICLKITFNNQYFLFMGDCTDNVLLHIDEENIPYELLYLKLPHHGCKNETMESYIDNNIINYIDVSGCAYRKNTTLKSTLDFYKGNSNIVSVTGNIEHDKNIHQYGVLRHVFNVSTGELISNKCMEIGNAIFKYGKTQ